MTYRWTFTVELPRRRTRSSTTPVRSPRSTTRTSTSARRYTLSEDRRNGRHHDAGRGTRPVAPSNVGAASMPNYAALSDAGDHVLRERAQDVRRTGRRLVLPRPAGVRPAVRRRPERGRQRHAERATTSTRSPCRCRRATCREGSDDPVDRRLEHDRRRSLKVASAAGDPVVPRRLRPGVAPRQPAGQRGRHPGRAQGRVQRAEAGERRHGASRPSTRSSTRRCRS